MLRQVRHSFNLVFVLFLVFSGPALGTTRDHDLAGEDGEDRKLIPILLPVMTQRYPSHEQGIGIIDRALLTRQPGLSFEAVEGVVMDHHSNPVYFAGMENINFSLIENLRREFYRSGIKVFVSPEQTPIQSHILSIFQAYAPECKVPTDASLVELALASVIHPFMNSSISPIEDAIFQRVEGNSLYRDLRTIQGLQSPWVFRSSVSEMLRNSNILKILNWTERGGSENSYPEQDWEVRYESGVHHTLFDEAEKLQPISIFYPVTPGEVGLAVFNKSFPKNIFPMGLTTQASQVHGIEMSPASLIFHDIFHAKFAENNRFFIPWVMETLDKSLALNLSASEFLNRSGSSFQKQYGLVMSIYEYLYQQSTGFLMQGRESEYKKMQVALFFGNHEYPLFSEKMYNLHDPINILQSHFKRVRSSITQFVKQDSLDTDYNTGESPLEDKEIRKRLWPELVDEIQKERPGLIQGRYNPGTGKYELSKSDYLAFLNTNTKTAEVVRTPYSIDLNIELNDGYKVSVYSLTNKVILALVDDYRKILGFTGQEVSRPVLGENHSENKGIIKAYYSNLRQKLFEILDFFEQEAEQMIDPGILSGRSRFSSDYFQESWDNHQRIQNELLEMDLNKWDVRGVSQATTEEKEVSLFSVETEKQVLANENKRARLKAAKEAGKVNTLF